MKAKEYIAKYKADLESEDIGKSETAAVKLFNEFNEEVLALAKSRNVKRNSALVAILKEQNIKWNAVVRAFPRILIRDGFKAFWVNKMPELEKLWR